MCAAPSVVELQAPTSTSLAPGVASVTGTAGRIAPAVQAVMPAATTAAARNRATTMGVMAAGYGARRDRVALLRAGTGEQPAWTAVSAATSGWGGSPAQAASVPRQRPDASGALI
ncbi:hypothetical protein GCM10007977_083800 [Dactylosporangium sucinum]|uniref:Uncharacterized protein n=1 Tax=Dactylosporangium sucinum TaxID=1424081 RepID=A0A917UA31_9ACTN|nr:hypothetical protein GCM10007977_083800 [Dactylosporangium sucinum]